MAHELPRAFSSAFSVQSSQPMLSSQSSADAYTRVGDAETAPPPPPALPIRLEIYGLRVLTSTTLLMAALALLTFLLIDGFSVRTINATTLSADSKSALLDDYNTYSGSIASIASIPFLAFVSMLLPVFFLCFITKLALSDTGSLFAQWMPVFAVAALSWMLSQGLNAMNVQFGAEKVEFVIASNDLGSSNGSTEFSFVVTNISNTSQVAGNPSIDTILRSAIKPFASNPESSCSVEGNVLVDEPEASLRFGFSLNSWLEYMLPESLASEESFSFSMSDEFTTGQLGSSALPGGDVNKSAVLFSYGLWALRKTFDQGGVETNEDIYSSTKASDAAEFVTKAQTFMTNGSSSSYIGKYLNISMPDITVEFANFEISPQIKFEAVTFDLPVNASSVEGIMTGDWRTYDNETGKYSSGTAYLCNDHACILRTTVQEGASQDQVRVIRLCMTEADGTDEDLGEFSLRNSCQFVSNTSVLIVSIARQVLVDEVDLLASNIYLTNLRITHSVTVGRLSWETTDLSEVYGAACAAETDCDGLYFPLTNVDQHVVVGSANLPTPHRLKFPWVANDWQVLARSNTLLSSEYQGDLIYPAIYPMTQESQWWTEFTASNCTYTGSSYINDVIQRHIYSKDPLQPAYTAGLFWLFQNAALIDIEKKEALDSAVSRAFKLSFDGNVSWVSAIVSIPLTSAWITFCGCFVILIVGLLVTYVAFRSDHQRKIQQQLSVHSTAVILADSTRFPPMIIGTSVLGSHEEEKLQHSGNRDEDIHDFEITYMTLRHRSKDSIQDITIGDRPLLVSETAEGGLPSTYTF